MQQRRRRATPEELAQGQREMEQAQQRFQREATELPLRDAWSEEDEAVGTENGRDRDDALEVPSIEDVGRDDGVVTQPDPRPAATTPSIADEVRPAHLLMMEEVRPQHMTMMMTPNTRNPMNMPVPQAAPGELTNGPRSATPYQGEQGDLRSQPDAVQRATPMSSMSDRFQGQQLPPLASAPVTPAQPLFSEEQLRQMAYVNSQAPWLYQRIPPPPELSVPSVQRPLFLEYEEARLAEQNRKMEQTMKQMQELMSENEKLRIRLEEFEKRRTEGEPKFSTPDQGNSQNQPGQEQKTEVSKKAEVSTVQADEAQVQKEAETPKEAAPQGPSTAPASFRPEAGLPPGVNPLDFDLFGGPPLNAEVPRPTEVPRSTEAPPNTEPSRNSAGSQPDGSKDSKSFNEKSMEFMVLVVDSMRKLQQRLDDTKDDSGTIRGVETVRSGAVEFPFLPAWSASQGPLQLGDWLILIEPIIADLSATSEEWWRRMLEATEAWYVHHQTLSPLDKLTHEAKPPARLQEDRWQRLERRVATVMLQSIPEGIRDDLVGSRKMTVFAIMTHLHLVYAPGGVLEKQTLLKSLEEPGEITSMMDAPTSIRRWLRWKQRTVEVGATMPDPALLMKGLNRMMKRLLESNRDLQFRVSLVRNSLAVDVVPTLGTVGQFAKHLLAEVEQLALSDKRATSGGPKNEAPKVKSLEVEEGEKGKGKGRPEDDRSKCRFYLTDSGCRKGKDCKFSHDQRDDKKRCYSCGAIDHFSPSCPRKGGSESPKKRAAKVEGEKNTTSSASSTGNPGDSLPGSSDTPGMKELLEEATKTLRSLSSEGASTPSSTSSVKEDQEENGKRDLLEKLHQQLKSMTLKALKLSKMSKGSQKGLIDSGATHPLRPRHQWEDVEPYKVVEVTLANGSKERLRMSPSGTMIACQADIEPIIPMGSLIEKLKCQIEWSAGGVTVRHPHRGILPVTTQDGCPQLPRSLVMALIGEVEEEHQKIQLRSLKEDEELLWLRELVNRHPVLQKLPKKVQDELIEQPGTWSQLPGNKRQRKSWRDQGFLLHLYAGPDEGFTLGQAWRQQGGDPKLLMEVDVKRGSHHDMMVKEGVYAGLLRSALDGKIKGVLGGPNCRTRSFLRHIPIPGREDCPRPVRRWGGEEDGIEDATSEEREKIFEDDVMLWKLWFLFMVSSYVRGVMGHKEKTIVGMEHPASPRHWKPEV